MASNPDTLSDPAFMNVKPNMKIWKEEIFGPVHIASMPRRMGLSLANDSEYGLSEGFGLKISVGPSHSPGK